MRYEHFTDDMIAAVIEGRVGLTTVEREFLVEDTPRFEECSKELAGELPAMNDPDLMRAAFVVWADYATGQT